MSGDGECSETASGLVLPLEVVEELDRQQDVVEQERLQVLGQRRPDPVQDSVLRINILLLH